MEVSSQFHPSAVLTLEERSLITIGWAPEQVWLWNTPNFLFKEYLHVPYIPHRDKTDRTWISTSNSIVEDAKQSYLHFA